LDISCIVLAGGKGLRLGHNKVLESIGNRSLLQRVVSSISSFKSDIIIVTASGQSFPELAGYPRWRIVTDIYPGKGALGGVYTGLVASNSFYNLVLACDMPFLNQALLRYMIQLSASFDAVVLQVGNFVEPLHAVYSKGCLGVAERLLKQGSKKVRDILPLVRVRYVETEDIDRFDPKHLSIFNVNTEADLKEARELIRGETNNANR